jgi:ubiquinone/menaquinone biosynthesis C-methylase UbiE
MTSRVERDPAIVPALRLHCLTRFYDFVIGPVTREPAVRAAVVVHARIEPAAQVLDVGAGTGSLAIMLKRFQPTATVVGVDADPQILAIASRKSLAAAAYVSLIKGTAQHLPFDRNQFDCVVTSLLLHHLNDCAKAEALAEMLRVLRPGGRLVLADWDRPRGPLMHAAFLLVRLLDGWTNTRAHAAGQLAHAIARAGFANVAAVAQFSTCCGTLTVFTATNPAVGGGLNPNGELR